MILRCLRQAANSALRSPSDINRTVYSINLRLKSVQAAASLHSDVNMHPRAEAVLDYWFGPPWKDPSTPYTWKSETGYSLWFNGGPDVDKAIIEQFSNDTEKLINSSEYDTWINSEDPAQVLAAVVLGDQMTRNVYRGTAKMYAADAKVYQWVKKEVASGAYKKLRPIMRMFFFLPFMHVEDLAGQDECIRLFKEMQDECSALGEDGAPLAEMARQSVQYAIAHRNIIAEYGRFPHRNAILGRESTKEEAEGLAAGTIASF